MWLRKQFISNFVFPTWACVAGFNNNKVTKLWKNNLLELCKINENIKNMSFFNERFNTFHSMIYNNFFSTTFKQRRFTSSVQVSQYPPFVYLSDL